MIDRTENLTFEMLYRRYKLDVLNRTLTLLKNHHDAEDAAQETWRAVAENISAFRKGDPTFHKATILRIAKYKAIDLFRSRCRNDALTEEEQAAEKEVELFEDSVFEALCEKETVQTLAACLREMDARYTDVLRLYFTGEYTVRKIAALMDIPPKTAETRLRRGKIILTEKLKERGIHDETKK